MRECVVYDTAALLVDRTMMKIFPARVMHPTPARMWTTEVFDARQNTYGRIAFRGILRDRAALGPAARKVVNIVLPHSGEVGAKWERLMFGFRKNVGVVVEETGQPDRRRLVKFIEESCTDNLLEILSFQHADWDKAELGGDFRTLVTMYAAACSAYEKHADHMFSEWMKGAQRLGIDCEKTTEFYFMVNRRFSHLAQVRCYLDQKLKLTLVPADVREKHAPELKRILSAEMTDAFFPTPAPMP